MNQTTEKVPTVSPSQPDHQPFTTHAYGAHPSQYRERWIPADQRSAAPHAILIHGGYWRAPYGCDLMHPMAAYLVSKGWTVDNIEYRRIGQTENPWPAMADDINRAVSLSAEGSVPAEGCAKAEGSVPAEGSVIIGHSAGGHLALWAAAQPQCPALRGVVALAPLANLQTADRLELSNHATSELFGSDPAARAHQIQTASPHHLVPLGAAQLIVHGDADTNVPQGISTDYVATARNAGDQVSYLNPVGVDHFDIIDPTTTVWATTMGSVAAWR